MNSIYQTEISSLALSATGHTPDKLQTFYLKIFGKILEKKLTFQHCPVIEMSLFVWIFTVWFWFEV